MNSKRPRITRACKNSRAAVAGLGGRTRLGASGRWGLRARIVTTAVSGFVAFSCMPGPTYAAVDLLLTRAPAPATQPTTVPPPDGAPAVQSPAAPRQAAPAPSNTRAPSVDRSEEDARMEQAAKLFQRGTRSYETGDYAEAITAFERAFELSEEPSMLFNIGQAYWKRYDVDPNIDHLRRARALFANFDKLMRAMPAYDPDYDGNEIGKFIAQIDAQITQAESRAELERQQRAVAAATAVEQIRRSGPSEAERRIMRFRATRGSGVGLIAMGSLTALLIGVGLALRGNAKILLDSAQNDQARGINFLTEDQDRQYRQMYLQGGQLTFATIVATSVLLPVGIGLTITGGRLLKRERKLQGKIEKTAGISRRSLSVRWAPRLLDMQF